MKWAPCVALVLTSLAVAYCTSQSCVPIYVRWPRVKLNLPPAVDGALPFAVCKKGCTNDTHPIRDGTYQQCSAFNHRNSPHAFSHQCQLYPKENVQHIDGYIEADDRYSFYWKYCVKTDKQCTGEFAFTFLSDRYIAAQEVARIYRTKSLEDCLGECLNENNFLCRSVSFNRTDGGCHMSTQNQLSKPALIKLNNNPNYRIDYYENNCFNIAESFDFSYKCEKDGIRVKVNSKFPYTGALYGLYDFFTCRVEPKEASKFEYIFPYPTVSRNCSDSIRFKGNDMILEVVLSTDGVEPLYFITPDDLTYQARCPIIEVTQSDKSQVDAVTAPNSETERLAQNTLLEQDSAQMNDLIKLLTAVEANSNMFTKGPESNFSKGETAENDNTTSVEPSTVGQATASTTVIPETTTAILRTLKPITKDTFLLPFQPTTTTGSTSTTTTSTTTVSSTTTTPTSSVEPTISTVTSFSKNEKTLALSDAPVVVSPQATVSPTTVDSNQTDSLGTFRFNTRITFPTKNSINLSSSQFSANKAAIDAKTSPSATTLAPSTTTTSPTTTTTSTTPSTTTTTTTTTPSTTTPSTTTTTSTTPQSTSTTTTTPTPTSSTTTTTVSPTTTTSSETTTTAVLTTSTLSEPAPPPVTKPSLPVHAHGEVGPPATVEVHPPGYSRPGLSPSGKPTQPIIFDIFHNGQPADAVVVGSRITLSFTPYYAISPTYMSISGCQVEPIGSSFDWEREPMAIVKDGCQADNFGLVCPPQKTDYGIRVTLEAFPYQSTVLVQYTCLVRVCPFAVCPHVACPAVDGCPRDDVLSRTFGFHRSRRQINLDQIRAALAANPRHPQQHPSGNQPESVKMSNQLSQQLLTLGGDHLVRKKLVVVNTEEDLQYYIKTGAVPDDL